MGQVVEDAHGAHAQKEAEQGEGEVLGCREDPGEHHDGHKALEGVGDADVVHAAAHLLKAVHGIERGGGHFIEGIAKDGKQQVGSACDQGVGHEQDDAQAPCDQPQPQVLSQGMLAVKVADLIDIQAVVHHGRKDEIDAHHIGVDARCVVAHGEAQHKHGDKPLAEQVEKRARAVPRHVLFYGKRPGAPVLNGPAGAHP